jgi:hypothetical protein
MSGMKRILYPMDYHSDTVQMFKEVVLQLQIDSQCDEWLEDALQNIKDNCAGNDVVAIRKILISLPESEYRALMMKSFDVNGNNSIDDDQLKQTISSVSNYDVYDNLVGSASIYNSMIIVGIFIMIFILLVALWLKIILSY